MYRISIHNSQNAVTVDTARIREVCEHVLQDELVAEAEISVAIVDGRQMRTLNARHLDHDYDTDVLSFLFECATTQDVTLSTARRGQGKLLEGEIIVSGDMAQQTATRFQWSPQEEIDLYVTHGLLHLLGYDDRTAEDQSCMRVREAELLSHFGRHVSHNIDYGATSNQEDAE